MKLTQLIFILSIFLLGNEKEDILIAEYSYSIKMEELPTATVVNSTLIASKTKSVYEMDFVGDSNFLEEREGRQGKILSIKPKNNPYIYKDLLSNNFYSIERVGMKPFLVEDNIKIFDWKLENEFKDILNYKCQKATTFYRGRNYVAYFSSQIPFNNGPWKFAGLPGLIMEVKSTDGVFQLEINKLSIKKSDTDIKNPYRNYLEKKVSWKEFTDEYKRKYEELLSYTDPDGGSSSIPAKKIELLVEN
ncbi:GLPGLI family protein [Psychroserpens damuponensis]|uniref:GLPGLI family protein n=1 Tax=Psychroserpens damuponensis TaxID=943936 RepID=UPI0006939219|nr:GLPGLI family protein [Psychroserpens damuponensis]